MRRNVRKLSTWLVRSEYRRLLVGFVCIQVMSHIAVCSVALVCLCYSLFFSFRHDRRDFFGDSCWVLFWQSLDGSFEHVFSFLMLSFQIFLVLSWMNKLETLVIWSHLVVSTIRWQFHCPPLYGSRFCLLMTIFVAFVHLEINFC